jgi:hypothetical protein
MAGIQSLLAFVAGALLATLVHELFDVSHVIVTQPGGPSPSHDASPAAPPQTAQAPAKGAKRGPRPCGYVDRSRLPTPVRLHHMEFVCIDMGRLIVFTDDPLENLVPLSRAQKTYDPVKRLYGYFGLGGYSDVMLGAHFGVPYVSARPNSTYDPPHLRNMSLRDFDTCETPILFTGAWPDSPGESFRNINNLVSACALRRATVARCARNSGHACAAPRRPVALH